MNILVGYATSEGQTRKIARFVSDHLNAQGHSVELLEVDGGDDPEIGRFDAVILAGSLHAGGYQRALVDFAKARAPALAQIDDLFLAVSLSAAGQDEDDWAGLNAALAKFQKSTGWTPDRIEHVAGAFRFTEYNVLERFFMRRIAAEKDPDIDTHGDTEYTDWAQLAETLDAWCATVIGQQKGTLA